MTGLSGDDQPAKTSAARTSPWRPAQHRYEIKFAHPEADGDYAVFVEQSWLTSRAVSGQDAEGFTVTFDNRRRRGEGDWMIVR